MQESCHGKNHSKGFPKCGCTNRRCKDDWTTRAVVYQGISWRTRAYIPANIEFKDISHIERGKFHKNHLLNCNRVLNFRTHLSVNICLVCKGALEKKQSDSYKTDMTEPSMSKIPIDHSYIGYKKARKSNVENICDNSKSDHEGTCKRPLADITNTIDISGCQAKPSSSRLDHNYIVKRKAQKSDVDKKCESSKCEGTAVGPQLADIKHVNDKSSCCQAKPSKTSFQTDHHDHTSDSNTHITLTEADNSDMEVIFNEVSKDCPPNILELLMSHKNALSSHPNGRRWDTNIIRLCLTLWCRSPKCYADLRESGFLVLPSQKLLQIYKNKIHQKAGLNKELLHWMKNEAMHKNIPPEGYEGGLILDEMSIQSDLQFY